MGLGHRDQVTGDFPGGEQPQAAAAAGIEATPGQILPPRLAGLGDAAKALGGGRAAEPGQRQIGVDGEIGGQAAQRICFHARGLICCVFASIRKNTAYGRKDRTRQEFYN